MFLVVVHSTQVHQLLSWRMKNLRETTREIDYGLSLGLFNNRVTIEADYYDKET